MEFEPLEITLSPSAPRISTIVPAKLGEEGREGGRDGGRKGEREGGKGREGGRETRGAIHCC